MLVGCMPLLGSHGTHAQALLDSDHHRVRPDKRLDTGCGESRLLHPRCAVSAGVVEACWCFDEHVQAHQESKSVLRAIVVDDGLVDDEGSAGWQGIECLSNE